MSLTHTVSTSPQMSSAEMRVQITIARTSLKKSTTIVMYTFLTLAAHVYKTNADSLLLLRVSAVQTQACHFLCSMVSRIKWIPFTSLWCTGRTEKCADIGSHSLAQTKHDTQNKLCHPITLTAVRLKANTQDISFYTVLLNVARDECCISLQECLFLYLKFPINTMCACVMFSQFHGDTLCSEAGPLATSHSIALTFSWWPRFRTLCSSLAGKLNTHTHSLSFHSTHPPHQYTQLVHGR